MSTILNRSSAALIALASSTSALASDRMPDTQGQTTRADEIVVTASGGREQQVKDAPASISVLTRKDLDRLPYREVTDALLEIPGVTVTPGEGNSRDISIRGMAPQYTLILVDGKRLSSRETRTNGGNISEGGQLPPLEAIERIEVVRGPMSSLYGSDAMGGVVNIITRRISKTWRGSTRANGTMQLGSDYGNVADGNFYLSGPIAGSVGVQVQGAATRRGEDRVIGGTPERRDESLAGKLGWNAGPDHSFLAELGYYRQTVTATAGKTVATSATVPTGMENVQAQRRYVGSISHSGRWGFVTSESYLQLEDAKSLQDGKRIKNTIAQSIWMVPLPANSLSVGAYYRNEDLTDTVGNLLAGSTRDGASRRQVAVFAENELTVLTGLRLTGGLRMDDDQQYGTHWTPRVYAVWNIDRAFTLKGGYSQGFRAPNLRQTLPDWGQSSRGGTIYGNPDLNAETSRTIEAGLLFDGGTFQASLTAYDTRFDDKITRVTCVVAAAWCSGEPLSSIGRPPTTYVNVDKAKVRGIEATIDMPLTATLRVNATGTLTDSEQLSGANIGAALNDTPKQQASASLNWKPTTRLNGYIRGIFRGQEAITEAQISGNATVAPSYTTVDIGASYKVSPRFTLHGGVQNVLDKRLSYDRFGYVIDPARIWLGIGTRF
ncbi:outer membrane receptor for ferrienterochelin and colicins [Sphingomonas sp. SORGH_AS802]|uniref:TonB-dependent receptor domain-containing protein n=1 Tax=unclassified Sphingomonas TaxID=196159 RepID=UPI002865AEA8|nr:MULTISPECIES: TonB-dependent receptor [unclassified Sphingomonas]MDR6127088.1 outer membrane receptor for ferrienterochelin and colicins [Sphingomonas sp. SORGH_AS_0438]MDR6134550.1 outer membrane receptor for ferrienterochelin and colicins [Sphingomonas sp. SORGH_AS_0802]